MANCCEKVVHLEMNLRSMGVDVHSANAGIVPSAAWGLVWALGTMKNEKEEILVKGLCNDGEKALNIVGLDIGYNGVGSKTIVPATAKCKVDVCPAEGLRAEDVCAKIRTHLAGNGFEAIEVTVC